VGDDLTLLDATAQAELVRGREVSPEELVRAAMGRIERLNPKLNAVIIPLFERALDATRSQPLSEASFPGVPLLVKDLGCTIGGAPYHAGMRLLKEIGWVAPRDAHLATKLERAGFIFVGRTNTPELGHHGVTEPVSYGPTRNPWDTTRTPGGSSGGSAAAVASGMVAAAHGSDAGGSIRNPASSCGLVGLKPSRGRTSLGPDLNESWGGLGVEHVLTRSVRDTAAILDAVHGPMPGDPYGAPPPARAFRREVGAESGSLRIGLLARSPAEAVELPADVAGAAVQTGGLLESLGHHVEESHPDTLESSEPGLTWFMLVSQHLGWELDRWSEVIGRQIEPRDVEPANWAMAELGRSRSAPEHIRLRESLRELTRRTAWWWADGFDLLVTPTLGMLPAHVGEFESPPDVPLEGHVRTAPLGLFTVLFNLTGQPAISLPLHTSAEGLPIGVQLVAAYGREDLLFRVAAQLEQARPWADRLPAVHASSD
jgi:amidase